MITIAYKKNRTVPADLSWHLLLNFKLWLFFCFPTFWDYVLWVNDCFIFFLKHEDKSIKLWCNSNIETFYYFLVSSTEIKLDIEKPYSSDSGSVHSEEIAGIVLGVIVVFIMAALALFIWKKLKRKGKGCKYAPLLPIL